jgi:hypothetical protein
MGVIFGEFRANVGPYRLQHHVDAGLHAKSRPQRGCVDLMRAEVIDDCRLPIEQRLDIDEFPRPVAAFENALTSRKLSGTLGQGRFRACQIVGASGAKHSCLAGR